MDINLYKFNKRPNSTKRPSSGANTFNCQIIENTSIINPSIRINANNYSEETIQNVPVASFHSNIGAPIKNLQIDIVAQQASGTPTPQNPIPISGFSVANIHVADGEEPHIVDVVTTVDFGRTVYGGTLNVTTGELTVTWWAEQITNMTISKESSCQHTFSCRITGTHTRKYGSQNFNIKSAIFKTYTVGHSTGSNISTLEVGNDNTIFINSGSANFYISTDSSFDNKTATDFRTEYGSGYIIYELSTPETYQLAPKEIAQLLGENTIWSDTGNIISLTHIDNNPSRVHDFNYAYIPDFNRYYFITDIIYELGTWVFKLTCDVLASYKNVIGSSSHYIERSAYEFDGTIVDGMYPEKADPELVIIEPEKVGSVTPTIYGNTISPSYIVGIIGGIAQENVQHIGEVYNGSVVYFSLTQQQLGELVGLLMDSVNLYQIPTTEISEELQKQLINPIQYIHSIKCVPFTPNTSGAEPSGYVATAFLCGFQYVSLPAGSTWGICKAPTIGDITKDNGYMEKRTVQLKLPLHPEYKNRGKWVLGTPVSKYVFDVTPFGQIEIPSGEILHAPINEPVGADPYILMEVTTVTDISTGDCTLFLNWGGLSEPEKAFFKTTKHISIDVPVHQAVQDAMGYRQDRRRLDGQVLGAVGSFIKAGAGMFTNMAGGALAAGLESFNIANQMMNTIDSATQANQVQISGGGSEGSYMSFNKDLTVPRVRCYFSPLAEEHNAERGKPLCQVRQISNIPGYILCSGAEIATSGTADENNRIMGFMNGGFFYE